MGEKQDAQQNIPLAPGLVDATTSADSIRRFMSTVKAWRTEANVLFAKLGGLDYHIDRAQRIQSLDGLMVVCQHRSQLFSLLEILISVRLYRSLPRNESEITSEANHELVAARGGDPSKSKSVSSELVGVGKWARFCGMFKQQDEYEGVLCFLPPAYNAGGQVTKKVIRQMEMAEIDAFRAGLKAVGHAGRLCEVGRAFQRGVFGEEDFKKRPFEDYDGELSGLEVEQLLELL